MKTEVAVAGRPTVTLDVFGDVVVVELLWCDNSAAVVFAADGTPSVFTKGRPLDPVYEASVVRLASAKLELERA